MSKIVGIDLGTTFSAIAYLNDLGKPEIAPNFENNQKILPSAVYINKATKKVIVGEKAINALVTEEDKVVEAVKKKMANECVWTEGSGFIDKNTADKNENEYTPAQISSFILKKLSEFNEGTEKVVVTVPAMFAEPARRATTDAVKIAGLELVNLINEPTAALLYYATIPDIDVSGTIMVFDLGGGTFDITIAEVNNTDIEIKTSVGDPHLGGHDFDKFIVKEMSQRYEKEKGKPLSNQDHRKLRPVAEKIKKTLSFKQNTSEFIDGPEGPYEFHLTRDEFNSMLDLKLSQMKMAMEQALDEAVDGKPERVNQILLVGGSTRIPLVVDLITNVMGRPPVNGVNVDEAVALGAAVYAGLNTSSSDLSATQKKSLKDVKLSDISNQYFGTGMGDIDPSTGKDIVVNDILIPRNTKLPYSITKPYVTRYDGQIAISCDVTQSEHEEKDMEFVNIIANEELKLPPDRPAGQPIEVTFSYDKSGMMHCEFIDINTGEKKVIDLRPDSSLNPDDAELDFKID